MTNDIVPAHNQLTFEELRKTNTHQADYWSARDLQLLLGYGQWRRFEDAIRQAIISCTQSGNEPSHHFAGAGKMITLGKGGTRQVPDYHLSRFACYLIAQNGDPRKPEIAYAQKYFAIQTRRQEISDALAADQERLELRKQAVSITIPARRIGRGPVIMFCRRFSPLKHPSSHLNLWRSEGTEINA